ncbi:bifunctional phosphoribosylaminoimidazole carboxylase/phosphoribosylaminoimidazole succinocarboxamide synthetase isoform X3 [Caretta caretta]|uniref:bifunctional phosphoribosylaminoimidazole carboxylase/phosphoribosylaminoimidazole succinocarboxamide synthetase isoform X3 n=1 Tax=Caretta caretta TaxID=8467 RepID=UPI003F4C7930
MESGAGKHWTEEEVKALLSVWSEKNIRKQLHGTLRNKGIFIYIAKRLQELGVCRDWKQCRAKYKNLKYEFRTVKYAHNSGDATKTMKFFHDLDAILQYEPVTQLTEDENGKCSATERQLNISTTTEHTEGEISVALEEDEDVPEDPLLFISHVRPIELEMPGDTGEEDSVSNMSEDLRVTNIEQVSDTVLPDKFKEDKSVRNLLEELGATHIKEEDDIGLEIPEDKEDFINFIPEDLEPTHIKRETIDIDDDSISTTSEDISGPSVVKQITGTDNLIPLDEAQNHFRVITVHDTGAGKHWSDNEVRALINIWSDEKIQQMLEGATRNKEIFEEIARRLMKIGIDRDWKQCRTKYKNLKYEYRALQKENDHLGNPRRKMRFYDEVDCIFRRQPLVASSWGCESSNLISESVGDIITNTGPWGIKRKASDESSPGPLKKSASEKAVVLFQRSLTDRMHTVTEGKKALLERLCKQEETQDISRTQLHGDPPAIKQVPALLAAAGAMAPVATELKLGKKINEGKTKEVYELPDLAGCVMMQSKDQITAGNAARKDHMEGKAAISNATTSCVFQLLHESGIKTAFVRKHSDTAFIAAQCEMIPIEWVCRRIATGSFLKRNPGVKEGYKFYPPKIEMFYKDDAANDPQWSEEQLIEAKFCFAGLTIGQTEVDIMAHSTQAIFEILEKSWLPQNCTLVDMKIEFGVNITTKEIVLADVIDNDSWRLWPSGDRSQQKDKQSYRDLKEVTPEALQMVKRNFEWVAERVELLLKTKSHGRVVVLMGSSSDLGHCEKIKKACANFGIPCELRVTSAHKGPDETLRIKAEYEGDGIPTVFVAVAGRSNGLGPVLSGNTSYPVVSCPPLSADWGAQDVWSSLRLPSGLGCPTILSPEGAAQFAAEIFGLNNHLVWAKLRSSMLNTWISLKQADKKLRECTL